MEKTQKRLEKLRSKQKKILIKAEKEDFKQKKKQLAEEAKIAKEEEKKNKLENRELCNCGGYYTLNHKAHHIRTKKHLEWLITQGGLGGGEGEP